MFKKNGGYSRLDSPLRRSDYSQYSAESSRDGGGQTFHFSSVAVDSAEDELVEQEYELRSRGSGVGLSAAASHASSQLSDRTEYITHDVTSHDTLQTISLKYSVPIAELKRANKLYSEKELCARRFIRIPVRPNSVLTEPPTGQLVTLSPGEPRDDSGRASPTSSGSRESAASTEVRPFGNGVREGHKLLKNVDREVTAVRAKADELRAEGVLADGGGVTASWETVPARSRAGLCSCSGEDCGMHWLCLLAVALLLLAVVPVWYILREWETGDLSSHHHHDAVTTPSGTGL